MPGTRGDNPRVYRDKIRHRCDKGGDEGVEFEVRTLDMWVTEER